MQATNLSPRCYSSGPLDSLIINDRILYCTSQVLTEDAVSCFSSHKRSIEKSRNQQDKYDIVGIYLPGTDLTDGCLSILMSVILRSECIQLIDLSNNYLTQNSIAILVESIKFLPNLFVLNLSNNGLASEACVTVARAFFPDASNQDIANSNSDDDSIQPFKRSPRLAQDVIYHLDLSDNNIGADACCRIAAAIKCNCCKSRLYLRGIMGGSEAIMSLLAIDEYLVALDASHAHLFSLTMQPDMQDQNPCILVVPNVTIDSPLEEDPIVKSPGVIESTTNRLKGWKKSLLNRKGKEHNYRRDPTYCENRFTADYTTGKTDMANEQSHELLLCICESLSRTFSYNRTLSELHLSYLDWTVYSGKPKDKSQKGFNYNPADELVNQIGTALKSNTILRIFSFAGNGLTTTGLEYLCNGMKESSIEVINISCNDFEQGIQPLCEILKDNKVIRVIDLANCNLDNYAVAALGIAIRENLALLCLTLAHNPFSTEGLFEITNTLKYQSQHFIGDSPSETTLSREIFSRRKICTCGNSLELLLHDLHPDYHHYATPSTDKIKEAQYYTTSAFNDPSCFPRHTSLLPGTRQRLLCERRLASLHHINTCNSDFRRSNFQECKSSSSPLGDTISSTISLAGFQHAGLYLLDISFTEVDAEGIVSLASALPYSSLMYLDVSTRVGDSIAAFALEEAASHRTRLLLEAFNATYDINATDLLKEDAAPWGILSIRGLPPTAIRLDHSDCTSDAEDIVTPPSDNKQKDCIDYFYDIDGAKDSWNSMQMSTSADNPELNQPVVDDDYEAFYSTLLHSKHPKNIGTR